MMVEVQALVEAFRKKEVTAPPPTRLNLHCLIDITPVHCCPSCGYHLSNTPEVVVAKAWTYAAKKETTKEPVYEAKNDGVLEL